MNSVANEIWGFHGGDDVLGLATVWTGWWKPTFRRSVQSPSSGLKWGCWESEGLYLKEGAVGPEKGWLRLSYPPLPPSTDTCLESPHWPGTISTSLCPDWPLPSDFPSCYTTTLHNPSDSQQPHFSPEDGDSMFLWNVGLCG
jgi:hypothetical protein